MATKEGDKQPERWGRPPYKTCRTGRRNDSGPGASQDSPCPGCSAGCQCPCGGVTMPADTRRTAPPSHLRPLPPKILPPYRSPWPIRSTFHANNTDRVPPALGRMAAWHGALSCSRGVPGSRISRSLHVPSRPGYFPWPPPAAGHAVSYRVVGTILVLRDAEHSAHLPVLLGSQWGAGHRPGAGRGHRRRLWGQRLSGHHPGRLAGRPGAGAGAHTLLFRRGGHAGARGAGAGAGGGRADRRAGVHRAGQRGG